MQIISAATEHFSALITTEDRLSKTVILLDIVHRKTPRMFTQITVVFIRSLQGLIPFIAQPFQKWQQN